MPLFELLLPLVRRWKAALLIFLALAGLIFSIGYFQPFSQRLTVYFSVVGSGSAPAGNHYYQMEGAERVAETIAGWVKNPAFRSELQASSVTIPDLRRRLTARKQNRTNVFIKLDLPPALAKDQELVSQALITTLEQRLELLNESSTFSFTITEPEIYSELWKLPLWVILTAAFSLSIFVGGAFPYAWEAFRGRISFPQELNELFPSSPLLLVSESLGSHDQKLLEQFILQFHAPRLIGSFAAAEAHFSLNTVSEISSEETPIILVQLGTSRLQELKNLRSLLGQEVGLIVFQ